MGREIPVHPQGKDICTCRWINLTEGEAQAARHYGITPDNGATRFVCDDKINGEDGLCRYCRNSSLCAEQRDAVLDLERAASG